MTDVASRSSSSPVLDFRDARVRAVLYQVAAAAVIGAVFYLLASNAAENLARSHIAAGFGFLEQESGFNIGESFIQHSAHSSYARTLLAGLLNTLYVSALGIVFATVLGVLLGIARSSSNVLLRWLSSSYLELFRDTPMLVQIVFWYSLTRILPPPRQALQPIRGVFLSNRGIVLPILRADPLYGWVLGALIVGIFLAVVFHRWASRRQASTGRPLPILWPTALLALAPPIVVWISTGAAFAINWPQLHGFNIRGGMAYSPEFAGLLMGLVTYSAAFIGEIVRLGIQAVGSDQREAARALGLSERHIMRYIVLPQAVRIIVPPLTNQYLSLVKDSSLGVWIGYPDLVSVANTTISQSGQALEGIAIMMLCYLAISLSISLLMNLYNRRVMAKR